MISPEKIAEMLAADRLAAIDVWAAGEEIECAEDDMPISAQYFADVQSLVAEVASSRSELLTLRAERDDAQELAERLKLEAQGHAMEARTANSTIYEIYQVVSGATGEPGNWHGAEPVRERFAALEAQLARQGEVLKPFAALGQYLIDQGFITKPDDAGLWGFDNHTLTYGDFRLAANVARSTLSPEDSHG